MVDVNLAVVRDQKIIKAETLRAGSGKPVTLTAETGARYVLAEGKEMVAPQNITVKRAGKNLWLMLEGSEVDQPQLVVENYYDRPGEIIGRSESGEWHAYHSANADSAENPEALQDGEQSPVLLDSEALTPLNNLSVDSNAMLIGLIGLGAAAAATALVLLTKSDSNDNGQNVPPPPPSESEGEAVTSPPSDAEAGAGAVLPEATLDTISDDIGESQGLLATGETTDDNQPTLGGSNQLPGTIIEVRDNGESLGTAIADSAGNWSFTPESALADGQHSLVVVVTDPSGAISLPSDPTVIVIETSSTPVSDTAPIEESAPPAENIMATESLTLEDLLPAEADPHSWAQISFAGDDGIHHQSLIPADDVSRLADDLLNSNPSY